MECNFFQAAVISMCTTWRLTKCREKKLDSDYTWMLWAIWKKSWNNIPQKNSYMATNFPSLKPFKSDEQDVRHCWRSKGIGCPARTYLQELCTDKGCSLEDLLNAMDNSDEWQGRVREMHACGTAWGWIILQSVLVTLS